MARILIVEDEQVVVEDLTLQLRRLGHEVAGTAASGDQAVRIAGALQPDLVLMDVRLQGHMCGPDAARVIQSMADVPVIYITAYSEVFFRDPGQMSPPGLCVTKPFSGEQLRAVIEVVLADGAASSPGLGPP